MDTEGESEVLTKLSNEQLQVAKIISQCLSSISAPEFDFWIGSSNNALMTRTVLTDNVAYGMIYLNDQVVSCYSMSVSTKLNQDIPPEIPRGRILYDIVTLHGCLIPRCKKHFPDNVDSLVKKIVGDTFEYHLATLLPHEIFIYLLTNTTVINRKPIIINTKEQKSKIISRCIAYVRDYIGSISPNKFKSDLLLNLPLVIPLSSEPENMRRRLSQPS